MTTKEKKRNFVALRLNDEKDSDIIEDLDRFKNMTERVKELYRKGLEVERGNLSASKPDTPAPPPPKIYNNQPLDWNKNLPKEPTVKPGDGASKSASTGKERIKTNIIQSF